ncbi:hypothetical protein AGR8A_pTi20064 [Agrobacterium fabrum str. J-07]|nr:hypothetical protein AGR8A_pTi20064 [Agrobacterium fabrum str. J-07]
MSSVIGGVLQVGLQQPDPNGKTLVTADPLLHHSLGHHPCKIETKIGIFTTARPKVA